MIGFWILVTLSLLASLALFAPVLAGRQSHSHIDRQRLNLMLHRQRQEELAKESSGEELEALQAELDKDLLGDLSLAEAPPKGSGSGRGSLWVALLGAPLLGIMVYSMLGRYDLADFRAEPQAAANHASESSPEIQAMINRLAERLKKEPGDVKGWLLLGRSYEQTEQFGEAANAYAEALKLAPDDLDVKASYAENLGQSQGGEYSGEPQRLAGEILAKDPKHRTALWLAGAAAAQSGDAPKAIAYLETLRAQFAKGSQDDQHLTKIISGLKGEAGQEEAPTTAAATPATGEKRSIRVKVTLAEALKSQAAPEDTVFIFARAASGPPMPLAIVRKQVKDLPLEATLDDSMGMVEGMNISAFDRLVIGARISKTGQALPQPGDLQGLTEPTAVQDGAVYAVEIKEAAK